MNEEQLERIRRFQQTRDPSHEPINTDSKGFYQTHKFKEKFDKTLRGKTIGMTRCEFDNYMLKLLSQIPEFVSEVNSQLKEMRMEVASLRQSVEAMETIKNPNEEDVHLINHRIDIMANKVELILATSTKKEIIKDFLRNAFPNSVGDSR